MVIIYGVMRGYGDYVNMFVDLDFDVVVIVIVDVFYVLVFIQVFEVGKYVFCEKFVGLIVEECIDFKVVVECLGKVFQVGYMKCFDVGFQVVKFFIWDEMGEMIVFKVWYCDNMYCYVMMDVVQLFIVISVRVKKFFVNLKVDLCCYYMLVYGCYFIDMVCYFVGDIVLVDVCLLECGGIWCWFIDVEFVFGVLGYLDFMVQVCMDWYEGFQIYGQNGSIFGKIYNFWYYKLSEVDIFCEVDGVMYCVLGVDGYFYCWQFEGFVCIVFDGVLMEGVDINDGFVFVWVMVVIVCLVEFGKLVVFVDVFGGV